MKREDNGSVCRAFINGDELKSKTMLTRDGWLFSYETPIGVKLPDGSFLFDKTDVHTSNATAGHITKGITEAVRLNQRFASVHFRALVNWGLPPVEARGLVAHEHPEWAVVVFESKGLNDWVHLTWIHSSCRNGGLFGQDGGRMMPVASRYNPSGPCAWVSRQRPESPAHLLWHVMPEYHRNAFNAGRMVTRFGCAFAVTELSQHERDVGQGQHARLTSVGDLVTVPTWCHVKDAGPGVHWGENHVWSFQLPGVEPLHVKDKLSPVELNDHVLELRPWE